MVVVAVSCVVVVAVSCVVVVAVSCVVVVVGADVDKRVRSSVGC